MKYTTEDVTLLNHESLPSRERGLKLFEHLKKALASLVAPLAGARIEIVLTESQDYQCNVAPLAGARIEIDLC